MVVLTFTAFQILHAPLLITDAKSDLDPAQAESKRSFTIAVQGPIVDLHKSLSRLVNQRVRYRARGTGLIWLDYDQKKSNAIKVHNTARRKLLLQDTNPPFDCASCKGSLHASDIFYLLSLLTLFILVVCFAACHHQGGNHVWKRCGTTFSAVWLAKRIVLGLTPNEQDLLPEFDYLLDADS